MNISSPTRFDSWPEPSSGCNPSSLESDLVRWSQISINRLFTLDITLMETISGRVRVAVAFTTRLAALKQRSQKLSDIRAPTYCLLRRGSFPNAGFLRISLYIWHMEKSISFIAVTASLILPSGSKSDWMAPSCLVTSLQLVRWSARSTHALMASRASRLYVSFQVSVVPVGDPKTSSSLDVVILTGSYRGRCGSSIILLNF